jgi:hypothetical protein
MPCHPHQLTRLSVALPGTTSALLSQDAGRGAVVRREAVRGIVADNLLTARAQQPYHQANTSSNMENDG